MDFANIAKHIQIRIPIRKLIRKREFFFFYSPIATLLEKLWQFVAMDGVSKTNVVNSCSFANVSNVAYSFPRIPHFL